MYPSLFSALWVATYKSKLLCSGEAIYSAFVGVCSDLPEIEYAAHASAPENTSRRSRLCLVSLFDSRLSLDLPINSFLTLLFLSPNPLRSVSSPCLSLVSLLYPSRYRRQHLPHIVDIFFKSVRRLYSRSFPHFRRQFRQFLSPRFR